MKPYGYVGEIKRFALVVVVASLLACASDGSIDPIRAVSVGVGLLSAATIDEEDVARAASAYARELDKKNQLAAADNPYAVRLAKITAALPDLSNRFNFKVYLSDSINAFAMADGTVRVYSGLMDVMPDDQVLAVMGHEIGHVKLKHSYRQMREQLLTNTAFQLVGGMNESLSRLTSSQLGALANQAIDARFSQEDELDSDVYAVRLLKSMGEDPHAMLRSIQTLRAKSGSGGGFLSSHPSNSQRIAHIQQAINNL